MYQNIDIFRTAGLMAQHAGARQAVTARNIANADTPDYQAMQMPSFADSFGSQTQSTLQTRPGHLLTDARQREAMLSQANTEPSPNGNSVSIEEEMMNAVAIGREHSRSLAIYKHGMTVLRTAIGR